MEDKIAAIDGRVCLVSGGDKTWKPNPELDAHGLFVVAMSKVGRSAPSLGGLRSHLQFLFAAFSMRTGSTR